MCPPLDANLGDNLLEITIERPSRVMTQHFGLGQPIAIQLLGRMMNI